MRYRLALSLPILSTLLTGCVSERHFARDSWPFGNPNAPANSGETAARALGQAPDVTPISPQAGNVWPGSVQPVPTIADIEKNMNTPLGQAYVPSLPSPYPPGQTPTDKDDSDYAMPPSPATTGDVTQPVPTITAPAAGPAGIPSAGIPATGPGGAIVPPAGVPAASTPGGYHAANGLPAQ